jgi:hypothetical protein
MEWLIGLGLLGVLLLGGYLISANLPDFTRVWERPLIDDFNECQGHTLVQRFAAHSLSGNGNQVRLILRASSTLDAWIDSIWISQQAPAGNPYDAAADLKQFYGKVRIRANTRLTLSDILPDVEYNLRQDETLLIAVDFERGAPSGVGYFNNTSQDQMTGYFLPPGAGGGSEAGKHDRSPGYLQNDRTIFLIEGIFVYQSFAPRIQAWLAKPGRRQSRGSALIRQAVL